VQLGFASLSNSPIAHLPVKHVHKLVACGYRPICQLSEPAGRTMRCRSESVSQTPSSASGPCLLPQLWRRREPERRRLQARHLQRSLLLNAQPLNLASIVLLRLSGTPRSISSSATVGCSLRAPADQASFSRCSSAATINNGLPSEWRYSRRPRPRKGWFRCLTRQVFRLCLLAQRLQNDLAT